MILLLYFVQDIQASGSLDLQLQSNDQYRQLCAKEKQQQTKTYCFCFNMPYSSLRMLYYIRRKQFGKMNNKQVLFIRTGYNLQIVADVSAADTDRFKSTGQKDS